MSSQATSDYRRRRKLNLIKVCGDKCNLCGYNKTIAALEFHHINPENKSYGIASMGTCHQLETDLKEVQKCILVCANCHREIHDGLYSQEELIKNKIYLDDIANELIQERDGKKHYCPSCGKEISSGANFCNTCARKNNRIVEDRPDREELKQLIRKYTFTELGRKYGISDNSVRKWCKLVNLPHRTTDIKKMSDEEWEKV